MTKRFDNPLETVLRVRRLQQRHHEARLSDALRDHDQAQTALDQIRDRKHRAAAHVPAPDAAGAGFCLLHRDAFVEHQRHLAARQEQTVRRAQTAVDQRTAGLIEARREVRKLETHREKLYENWQADMLRDEQRHQDDLAGRRVTVSGHGR